MMATITSSRFVAKYKRGSSKNLKWFQQEKHMAGTAVAAHHHLRLVQQSQELVPAKIRCGSSKKIDVEKNHGGDDTSNLSIAAKSKEGSSKKWSGSSKKNWCSKQIP